MLAISILEKRFDCQFAFSDLPSLVHILDIKVIEVKIEFINILFEHCWVEGMPIIIPKYKPMILNN